MKKRGKVDIPLLIIILFSSALIIAGVIYFISQRSEFYIKTSSSNSIENLAMQSVYEQDNNLIIYVTRGEGKGQLVGIKFTFSSGDATEAVTKDSNLQEFGGESFVIAPEELSLSEIKTIFITPIFRSSEGENKVGRISDSFNFVYSNQIDTAGNVTVENPVINTAEENQIEGTCIPNCISLQCGPDPVCGQLCGICDGADLCSNGVCVPPACIPESKAMTCGTAVCGVKINDCGQTVSCGTCSSGKVCNTNNKCITPICIDERQDSIVCNGKICGNVLDSCNYQRNCGACSSGQTCQQGSCISVCIPNCNGKTCGTNGCGGSCGTCSSGEVCNQGYCKRICLPNQAQTVTNIPSICKNNDYYCPWECNDWKLDTDCGVPEIYNFVESRNSGDYLNSNFIHFDDTSWRSYGPLVQKVGEITGGISDNFEKAKAIADWVTKSKTYGFPSPANEGKTVIDIFNSGTGVCIDAAILTVAMFRIAGIPARTALYGGHDYAEAYINSEWIGFDSVFGQQNALIAGPITNIVYNTEYYKSEPKWVTISTDGSLKDVINPYYYKVNVISPNLYRITEDVSIDWNLNTNKGVGVKYCVLSKYGGGESNTFNTFPISATFKDDVYSLLCSVTFTSNPTVVYNEIIKITPTGTGVFTQKVFSSGYPNITITIKNMNNTLIGKGVVYIPGITMTTTVFKNNDGSYSLNYEKEKYSGDYASIGWNIKADNLNCNYYTCSYTNSNQYSYFISPVGISGPPRPFNGFSRIELPKGNYKILYSISFAGDIGYKYFTVLPNEEQIIYPSELSKIESATQNEFDVLITALTSSVQGC